MKVRRLSIAIIAVLVFLVLIPFIVRKSQAPFCKRCNVIMISVNSLQADSLPCFGYRLPTAPALCAFAKNNILFTDTFANSNWTRPSTMSFITSLYPVSHGMNDTGAAWTLNPSVPTLATLLAKAGYNTTFVSNADPHIAPELGFGRGFRQFQFTPTIMTDGTLATWFSAIDSVKASNRIGIPAFVYLHTDHMQDYAFGIYQKSNQFPLDSTYQQPNLSRFTVFDESTWKHAISYLTITMNQSKSATDIQTMEQWRKKLTDAKDENEARVIFQNLPLFFRQDIYRDQIERRFAEADFTEYASLYRHLYDESIRTFDTYFAKVIARIRSQGLDDNTVIFFVSDHGDLLGEHRIVGQRTSLYDTAIHIPFIMRIPGITAKTVGSLTGGIDVLPTVLDLIGLPKPATLAGVSMADAITGPGSIRKNAYVVSQTLRPKPMKSIRTDKWKLILTDASSSAETELYDLVSDPQELTNVVAAHTVLVQQLSFVLTRTLERQPVFTPYRQEHVLPDTQEERLQRLNNGF